MENISHNVIENIVDPDPLSTLLLGTWFTILTIIGAPLNIFIAISTIKVKEIWAIPSNIFIASLAIADTCTLLSFALHLPYAITSADIICKLSGVGTGIAALVGICIPSFLAANRYAIVCKQQKLAHNLSNIFSRNGIYLMNFLLWLYLFAFNMPFIMLDTLGLQTTGTCFILNRADHEPWLHIYYYCGVLGFYFICFISLIFFYANIASWIKMMSRQLVITAETRNTVNETKNVMKLTKWITIIPLIATGPSALLEITLRIDANLIPVRVCRFFVSLFALYPFFNAFLTLTFSQSHRLAFKKFSKNTRVTNRIFSLVFERKWNGKIEVASGGSPLRPRATTEQNSRDPPVLPPPPRQSLEGNFVRHLLS